MPLRFSIRSGLAATVAASIVGVAALAWAAPADDFREAQKLYGQGRVQPALEKVDAFLKAQPRDAQGRFLKGILLTELKRTPEAIQVFTGLTEDFPELPEPYNNLAVLYASQGNYDKAKSALELAIHTHPSYATAHENLGDVYAQLASRAYDRALQLDKNNATAQSKLALIKDLFSTGKAGQRPEASRAAAAAAKNDATKVDVARAEPPKTAPAKPAAVTPAPAPSTPAASPAAPATPAASAAATAAAPDEKARVTAAVEQWAQAWSRKDVKAYLAAYAPDFQPPSGMTRAQWEKQRTERIETPKKIDVDVKMQSVSVAGNEATAVFRQSYRSDTLTSNNTKTLKLVKSGDRWLIRQERAGGS